MREIDQAARSIRQRAGLPSDADALIALMLSILFDCLRKRFPAADAGATYVRDLADSMRRYHVRRAWRRAKGARRLSNMVANATLAEPFGRARMRRMYAEAQS